MSQVSEPANRQDKSEHASLERMPDTEGAVSFVDNRASTVVQNKLADTMKASSSLVRQRAPFSGMFGAQLKPLQAKTAVVQRDIAEGSEEIKPGEKYESPTQDLGSGGIIKLYGQALQAQIELFDKTRAMAAKTKGAPSFPPGLKDLTTAKEKVAREYGNDPSKIVDLVRSTIEYEDVPALLKAMPQIQSQFTIVRLKNKFMNVTPSGYRDINMNIQLSNGHIGELQLNLKEVLALKAAQHKEVYEVERAAMEQYGKDKGSWPAEARAKMDALEAECRIKFDAAMAKAGSKEEEGKLKGIKEVGIKQK